ncbi:MAG: c-type cytochrome [Planctomycetales bacterium]|nr:c-type cytochrome [Planctomycetales bacterium]
MEEATVVEAAPDTPPAESSSQAEPAAEPKAETEPAPAPTDDSASSTEPASADVADGHVTLGAPELTAGIPGEGDLIAEEITAWLDEPANHAELTVSLPLGLSEGELQIKGLEDNPLTRAKIELGRQLYFDPRLSADSTVSCASCHSPDHAFARETQFGVGINNQEGGRNSPVAYNRILSDKQFWDGRAESLEAQAVGPIANPIEMGNTHDVCVSTVKDIPGYRQQFEKVFGDVSIDNVGKAIASFERTLVTGPTPYDYQKRLAAYEGVDPDELKADDPELYEEYQQVVADAEAHPMSESAKRGMEVFFSDRGGCSACHVGPNLTDERYHNLGVGMDAEEPDVGRFAETGEDKDKGAFKTPTIRNVALSAPYMHDGSQKTLAEVVDWYVKGGHPNEHLDENVKKLDLDDQAKQDLVAFMEACTGDFPQVETGRLPQ